MNKIYKFFGGRKFFMVQLSFVAGTALQATGKLTGVFVALITALNIGYSWGNSKSKEFSEFKTNGKIGFEK